MIVVMQEINKLLDIRLFFLIIRIVTAQQAQTSSSSSSTSSSSQLQPGKLELLLNDY